MAVRLLREGAVGASFRLATLMTTVMVSSTAVSAFPLRSLLSVTDTVTVWLGLASESKVTPLLVLSWPLLVTRTKSEASGPPRE